MAGSCAAAALALNNVKDKMSFAKDSQFVYNVADCLNGAKETYSKIRGIIKELPEVIDKVLPFARTQGLVLLSMYFLYNNFLLYDEAKNYEDNVKIYRDKFELLETEMKPFRNVIDTKLIPQWKAGNTANFEKTVDKLLEKFGRSCAVLQELTQAIRQDINKRGSSQRWSFFVATGGLVLCVGSLTTRFTPNVATPPSGVLGEASVIGAAFMTCGGTVATAAYSWSNYWFFSDTLPELERLEKATTTMSQELTRYRSELDVAKITGEFD